jgi:hypothetical protein
MGCGCGRSEAVEVKQTPTPRPEVAPTPVEQGDEESLGNASRFLFIPIQKPQGKPKLLGTPVCGVKINKT